MKLLSNIVEFVHKAIIKLCDLFLAYPKAGLVVVGTAAVGVVVCVVKKAIDRHRARKEERALKDLLYRYFTGKHVTTVTFNSTEEVVV